MSRRLAVFDIDGTIFRWTFIAELLTTLTKKGIFSPDIIKQTEKTYLEWKDRHGSWDDYINTVVSVTNNALIGKNEEEVNKAITEMIDYKKNNLYIFTRDLINKLKLEDYYLLAISASPEKIIAGFTKFLGFDKYFGTIYEVKDGKFTGRELNEIIVNKHNILANFLLENPQVVLKDSIGVGDSASDIPFLKMIEKPIAFNPDRKLAEYAKEKEWRIVVERKSVIYDIKDFEVLEK